MIRTPPSKYSMFEEVRSFATRCATRSSIFVPIDRLEQETADDIVLRISGDVGETHAVAQIQDDEERQTNSDKIALAPKMLTPPSSTVVMTSSSKPSAISPRTDPNRAPGERRDAARLGRTSLDQSSAATRGKTDHCAESRVQRSTGGRIVAGSARSIRRWMNSNCSVGAPNATA